MYWYLQVLKKYAVFSGRARRKEFWMFSLFDLIFTFILILFENAVGLGNPGVGALFVLYSLAVSLPILSVMVRRLHDTNRSCWWFLMMLIPIIGNIVLFIFYIKDSQPGENRYGLNPEEGVV